MNIVCIGEALIDFKSTGPLAFQGYVGGSPLNVSVAASRLGGEVGFATQISKDMFGGYLRRHMHENGIETSFVLEHEAPSTLAFVEEIAGEAHFTFNSAGAADTLYDPQPRPRFPDSVRFVEFGSISLLAEPAASAIVDIVRAHQDRIVIFDPNVRPTLIPNKDAYFEQLKGWLALSHIVKVSTQDLRWLYPDMTFAEVAKRWLELGANAVIVTQGEEGVSVFLPQDARFDVSAPKVKVVDTVGAGDTFTGALMTSLLDEPEFDQLTEQSWRKVLTFAAAAAALNCQRSGAQPPTRSELETFMNSRNI